MKRRLQELERVGKVSALRSENSLITTTGRVNAYRLAFYEGLGGTTKEVTWNKDRRIHECCQSKSWWRHKVKCPRVTGG